MEQAKEKQKASGIKLLWGTANLFSHQTLYERGLHRPHFHVLAHAGAQVKAALDATIDLDGENYVFWGGREGYMSLLNTNMKTGKRTPRKVPTHCKRLCKKEWIQGYIFYRTKALRTHQAPV